MTYRGSRHAEIQQLIAACLNPPTPRPHLLARLVHTVHFPHLRKAA